MTRHDFALGKLCLLGVQKSAPKILIENDRAGS